MVKAKTATQVVDAWKRKRWYRIIAPSIFNEMIIGETPSADPNMLIGRTASVNLMHLTRDMKKQNMNLVFKINKVLGDTAYTELLKFEIVPSSVRRYVRKGKERMDDSFALTTADNKAVRIKPLFVAGSNVKGSVATMCRKRAREFLSERVKGTKSDALVLDVVNYKLQKELRDALKKTYPLRVCEIRALIFEKRGEAKPEAVPEVKQEEIKAVPEETAGHKAAERTEEPKKEEKKPAERKKKKEESKEEKKEEVKE